jgi:serine/threonine-protein kinase RsbT
MNVQTDKTLPISSTDDIVQVRHAVRDMAVQLGFSLVDQTKLVTAASELARNAATHGGGGRVSVEVLRDERRTGLKLIFTDHGRGIPDIELAMKDGYTTGDGLGIGLGGARRLVNEFEIDSRTGEGVRVSIIRWK